MDVWRITIAALRRWYVLLPLLALTGIATVSAGNSVAPGYEAQASAMIMPARVEGTVPNPYGGADQANSALGIVLSSIESRQAVITQGLAASYDVGAQSRSTIFQISIEADSPEVAVQTGEAVLELARQELSTRQTESGLPPEAQYTLAVLEPPGVIAIVHTGKTRVQAVVGVLGAGISLVLAVLFDDIIGLWRRKRDNRRGLGRRAGTTAEAPAEPPTEDERGEFPPIEPVDRVSRAANKSSELPRRSKSRAKSQRRATARQQADEGAEKRPAVHAEDTDPSDTDSESLRRSGWIGPYGDQPHKTSGESHQPKPTAPDDEATTQLDANDIRAAKAGIPTSSGAARR